MHRREIVHIPLLGRSLVFLYRFQLAMKFILERMATAVANAWQWFVSSREHTNFTYDITPRSRLHLAAALASAADCSIDEVVRYFDELENDTKLTDHIHRMVAGSKNAVLSDPTPRYGRRYVWYAAVRILKPKLVVETGVDKGLGALVLSAALARNTSEGHTGAYIGTDINPHAGYLLDGEYARYGQVVFGDSLRSLRKLTDKIDLFVNDSDHAVAYETAEYDVIASKLSEKALLISDNCEVSDALLNFSRQTGRKFLYAQEQPVSTISPSGGVGLSYV